MEVQVNLLKKQLLLAQQACFLSLIQLDKDRNPSGDNQNHRYEDLREEIVKSGQQKINTLKIELHSYAYQCKCTDRVTAVTNPQAQTVNIKHTGDFAWGHSGRTGFIPCENGFTAEVRVLTPQPGYTDWYGVRTLLVTD